VQAVSVKNKAANRVAASKAVASKADDKTAFLEKKRAAGGDSRRSYVQATVPHGSAPSATSILARLVTRDLLPAFWPL
jgi:hypothetical protein